MVGRTRTPPSLSLPSFSGVTALSLGCEMLLSPWSLALLREVAGAEVAGGIQGQRLPQEVL